MITPSLKAALSTTAAILFFSLQIIVAQRLQVQAYSGFNASEAFIKDMGQTVRETSTFFDTMPNSQLGIAFNGRLTQHFHLRLDGNYRAYRTFFRTEEQTSNGTRYILGNLYNEKFSVSLLPEYRFTLAKNAHAQLPAYIFVGPAMTFEVNDNYQDSYVFGNGSTTFNGSIKPDAQWGWSIGGGVNPKWHRWGVMLEVRYNRFGYAKEGIPVGKIAYEHLTGSLGLTVDIVK